MAEIIRIQGPQYIIIAVVRIAAARTGGDTAENEVKSSHGQGGFAEKRLSLSGSEANTTNTIWPLLSLLLRVDFDLTFHSEHFFSSTPPFSSFAPLIPRCFSHFLFFYNQTVLKLLSSWPPPAGHLPSRLLLCNSSSRPKQLDEE